MRTQFFSSAYDCKIHQTLNIFFTQIYTTQAFRYAEHEFEEVISVSPFIRFLPSMMSNRLRSKAAFTAIFVNRAVSVLIPVSHTFIGMFLIKTVRFL